MKIPFTYTELLKDNRGAITRDGRRVVILYPIVASDEFEGEMLAMVVRTKQTYWVLPNGRVQSIGTKKKDLFVCDNGR